MHMTNKLKYLTKLSLDKKIKTKWFLIANIILLVIIAGIINIDSIIKFFGGDFDKKTEIVVIDNASCYNDFVKTFDSTREYLDALKDAKITKYDKDKESLYDDIKKKDKILLVINEDSTNFINVEMITKSNIDNTTYQVITTILNSIKKDKALSYYGVSNEILDHISSYVDVKRTKLDDEESVDEMMELVMSTIFPIVILPFFTLTMFLVQMIGAEINEEKTTRGMEIIISNVSPKVHFLSKIISGNVFVLLQGLLLIVYLLIGIFIRYISTGVLVNGGNILSGGVGSYVNKITSSLELTGVLDKMQIIIPITLILMVVTFVAYSLVAGILASMTTNMEDYQQVQTPIMVISFISYYLSVAAAMFKGSIFIKVLSFIPFFSALLAPSLLVLGQITIVDAIISILLTVGLIFVLVKYGLRIYKVGILNYSGTHLWEKMFKAFKS
ncbi:aBC-type transport system permease component [Clostridium sp. CAG:762]|nr:aBC-type transport system permease component [Clostridium sp. CAG:762]